MGKVGKTSCLDEEIHAVCCGYYKGGRGHLGHFESDAYACFCKEVASSHHCYGHSIPRVVDMLKGDSGL